MAQDGTGEYDVSPGEDASEVIQRAIDYAHGKGGGEVRIREGEYTVERGIEVCKDSILLISAYNATFEGNGNPAFIFNSKAITNSMQKLEGAIFRKSGIKIIDTYKVSVERCLFRECNIGVDIINKERWTESTTIQNCEFRKCNTAIRFVNKGKHPSFAQTRIYNVDIGGCDVGVDIGSDTSVIRSTLLNITIWLSGSKIGWKLNGKLNKTLIITSFDTMGQGGGTGFQLGKGFADGSLPTIICSYGKISTLVDNPYNKKFRIVTTDGKVYLYPASKPRDIIKIFSENESTATFRLSAKDRLNICVKQPGEPIVFWNDADGKRAEIWVGSVKSTGDIEISNPVYGLILRDSVTGKKFRLKVKNGVLNIEEVNQRT